jgi:hypothetical protein
MRRNSCHCPDESACSGGKVQLRIPYPKNLEKSQKFFPPFKDITYWITACYNLDKRENGFRGYYGYFGKKTIENGAPKSDSVRAGASRSPFPAISNWPVDGAKRSARPSNSSLIRALSADKCRRARFLAGKTVRKLQRKDCFPTSQPVSLSPNQCRARYERGLVGKFCQRRYSLRWQNQQPKQFQHMLHRQSVSNPRTVGV